MPEPKHTVDRGVIPRYEDPIRIVPLHVPRDLVADLPHAGPTPAPQLTYRGGPLLANTKVFLVFWGSVWEHAQSGLATQIKHFFTEILTSPLIDQLGEYSTAQFKIGHGQLIGSTVVTSPKPHKSISDTAIRSMLQHNLAVDSAFPQPDANTLYFVYTPPGSAIVQGGSRSCQAFCGYDESIGWQLFYAAMPFPNCNGCLGGLQIEQALTSTSSHELCEAITDPIPGQGWYDDVHGEIGDICAWQTKTVGQWTVQLEWSNKANKCV